MRSRRRWKTLRGAPQNATGRDGALNLARMTKNPPYIGGVRVARKSPRNVGARLKPTPPHPTPSPTPKW